MFLIAGLDGRLLTPFSPWLGSTVARPTFTRNTEELGRGNTMCPRNA